MKVRVHWNFHKKCFSVVSRERENYGKVIQHTNNLILSDVEFKVSEKGRQRVLREKRKNVHAYAKGTLSKPDDIDRWWVEVKYNPYNNKIFVMGDTPIYTAKLVSFVNGNVYASW